MTVISIVIRALGMIPKGLVKGLKETIQTTALLRSDQNTENCPGELRRHAVSQTTVKDPQLMLMRKTYKKYSKCKKYPTKS